MLDDDKIETIKESEIQRYIGDGISGSAYVLYCQAVDLDFASLGLKPPIYPVLSDVISDIPEVNEGAVPDSQNPLFRQD